jgi:predicted hydrocarbon binding protein
VASCDNSDDGLSGNDIRLFSTGDNVVAIDSPVKKKILDLLSDGDMAFSEIVKECGKAKSTVSVHISDLEKAGLIQSDSDPSDNRKKVLKLKSNPVGVLTNSDRAAALERIRKISDEGAPFGTDDIPSFFRWVVSLFRTEAMLHGINVDPILRNTGFKAGKVLFPIVYDPDLRAMVRNINNVWEKYGLGSVEMAGKEPIIIVVRDCFECSTLPLTGHSSCSFGMGVLSAIFSDFLNLPAEASETECYSTGHEHCRFVIKVAEG